MTSRRLVGSVALVLAVLIPRGSAEAAKPYSAERFSVRLSVESGGSMVVTETVRFAFGPDRFTYVFRELPTRKIDRLTVLSVDMDAVALTPGKQAGQYEVRRQDGGRRRITWHFAPVTGSSHEFTLVYRVDGVVEQQSQSDVLRWIVLPDKHEYPITCAELEVEYPESAGLIGLAEFNPAAAELTVDARPLRARRCGFGKDDDWMITLRFAPRSIATDTPGWQRNSMQTWKTAPLFLGIAGLVLFGGLFGFIMFALNHRVATPADRQARQTVPPDRLPVALAGTLVGTRDGISWANAIGTLFDLARRGVLQIKVPDDATWLNRRDCAIVLQDRPRGLREHERTLLDILFTTRKGPRDTVRFSQLSRSFASGGWKRFTRAVTAELRQEGLLDAEREHTKTGAMRVGLALLIAAVVGFGVGVIFVNRIGGFVLTIPGALAVAGLTGLIVGSALTPLSDKGLQRARLWKAYSRHLKAVSKGQSTDVPTGQLESLLPMAAAFGVALAWAKRLDKQGALGVPAWFQALAREDGRPNTAALVEMLSLASTAGAHVAAGAGGAAAAGAAGGGSSGAG
ncbi:MAG: DUF2207 domain-containing protein [Acidobacteria bacterium]|nr:DUF2207 domain-containing protein [Acidobacteriota bacterium]